MDVQVVDVLNVVDLRMHRRTLSTSISAGVASRRMWPASRTSRIALGTITSAIATETSESALMNPVTATTTAAASTPADVAVSVATSRNAPRRFRLASRARKSRAAIAKEDHAEQPDRGAGEDDLVDRAEENCHVSQDAQARQLGEGRLVGPGDLVGDLGGCRIDGHLVTPNWPPVIDLGDRPGSARGPAAGVTLTGPSRPAERAASSTRGSAPSCRASFEGSPPESSWWSWPLCDGPPRMLVSSSISPLFSLYCTMSNRAPACADQVRPVALRPSSTIPSQTPMLGMPAPSSAYTFARRTVWDYGRA